MADTEESVGLKRKSQMLRTTEATKVIGVGDPDGTVTIFTIPAGTLVERIPARNA